MIARLKPGASLEQAQSQIDAQNSALEQDDPKAKMMADAGFRSLVVSLHGDYVAGMTDRYAMDEFRRLTDVSVNG